MSTQQPAAAAAAPAASVVSDEAAAAQRKTAADRRAASRRSVAGKSECLGSGIDIPGDVRVQIFHELTAFEIVQSLVLFMTKKRVIVRSKCVCVLGLQVQYRGTTDFYWWSLHRGDFERNPSFDDDCSFLADGPISTAVPTSTNALPSLMTTNIPPPPAAGAAAAAAAPTVVGRVPSPLQQLRSPPAVQQVD